MAKYFKISILLNLLKKIFRKKNKCKHCWYYHRNIKSCALQRSIYMVSRIYMLPNEKACDNFIK